MTAPASDELSAVLRELSAAAEEFAVRAEAQEAFRDRARPGTAAHHQHAHSATLWRSAERALRTRALALAPGAHG